MKFIGYFKTADSSGSCEVIQKKKKKEVGNAYHPIKL
jgi:hypothetical protein